MSDSLVERLAARWHEALLADDAMVDQSVADDVRWWLNAIADELDRADDTLPINDSVTYMDAVEFLRSQARATHESETTEQK